MRSKNQIKKQVKLAAKRLDDVFPKWYDKVRVNSLNISEGNSCILGQLYESFSAAPQSLSRLAGFCANYEFFKLYSWIPGTTECYSHAYEKSWKAEIKRRRKKANA